MLSRKTPEANLENKRGAWKAIGFVAYAAGGLAAEACSRLGAVGTPLAFYIAAACTAVSALLPLTMEETLPPDKRKPFRLSRANPLSNLLLLVRGRKDVLLLPPSATAALRPRPAHAASANHSELSRAELEAAMESLAPAGAVRFELRVAVL